MSSFHLYILFHLTLWVASVPLENPLEYNMYLFILKIANHILIKILIKTKLFCVTIIDSNATKIILNHPLAAHQKRDKCHLDFDSLV